MCVLDAGVFLSSRFWAEHEGTDVRRAGRCVHLQAGNQIGENFWNMVLAEHGLDNSGVRHRVVPQVVG